MPIDRGFRQEMLTRKRQEYQEIVRHYFGGFSTEAVLGPRGGGSGVSADAEESKGGI